MATSHPAERVSVEDASEPRDRDSLRTPGAVEVITSCSRSGEAGRRPWRAVSAQMDKAGLRPMPALRPGSRVSWWQRYLALR
jgi:hypothetical protein